VGGKLQILGMTVVKVRSVSARGDAPGGHPVPTNPMAVRLGGSLACQEGSASRQCIPGPARAQIPEDTRGFAFAFAFALIMW